MELSRSCKFAETKELTRENLIDVKVNF
jgi:hypothetical protein